jgi:hypothetical protein
MAHPEGYRKAVRLMDLAEKFNLPVLSFPDTAGAYPGKGGEERGQAEAIARGTQRGLTLGVPFVTLIIGEGMSGGAIGIAAANKVLMMEHAIYSVISPEGCASILYRDAGKAKDAADAMKITAPDLLRTKVIDEVVKEPDRRRSSRPPAGDGHCGQGAREGAQGTGRSVPSGTAPPACGTFLRHRPRRPLIHACNRSTGRATLLSQRQGGGPHETIDAGRSAMRSRRVLRHRCRTLTAGEGVVIYPARAVVTMTEKDDSG